MMPTIKCPMDNRSYIMKYKLGEGGFANVYLGKSTVTGNVYAIKLIKKSSIKSSKQFAKTQSEIRLHSLCGITDECMNKYIVPFHKHWNDDRYIYILMKYCPNGSLQDWVSARYKKYNQPISELEIKFIIKQVTLGVKYLHDKFNIIHRDLKLGNIILDQYMNVQICDFGLATQLKQDESKKFTICGTPNFIAPEIAQAIKSRNKDKNERNDGHSYEVDIWAIGVMIYTLFYGKPPFQTNHIDDTVMKIQRSEFSFPRDRTISERLKHLISSILTVDIELRLSLNAILNHSFFSSGKIPSRLPLCCLKRIPTEIELFPDNKENNNGSIMKLRHEFNKKMVNSLVYVDHSDKYGLGYILSNGYTGVLFSDQTSLLLAYDKRRFSYIDDQDGDDNNVKIYLYDYKAFNNGDITNNRDLNKKYKIFQAFAKKLWNECKLKGDQFKDVFIINKHNLKKNNIVFVKRHKSTKQAMIFQMNQNIIHTIFNNKMHIGIHSQNNEKSTKIIVFDENPINPSLKEYDSSRTFNQNASRDAVNCAKHIQRAL